MTRTRSEAADQLLDERLRSPQACPDRLLQSLARGAAGVSLLHSTRAAAGTGTSDVVHRWLAAATRRPLYRRPNATLFYGAPAVTFAVHHAAGCCGGYDTALETLAGVVDEIVQIRLDRAHTRIDRGEFPQLGEFDLINGLTGLGALLRRTDPGGVMLARVLDYLVRLTAPLPAGLPGWWARQDATGSRATGRAGGHGNFGMAHGITGPLALLALTLRDGIEVPGHRQAIATITGWFDQWEEHDDHGPWWPPTITLPELQAGCPDQTRPQRPSWCYGTPGIARAQQLAGLAIGQPDRARNAEDAVTGCLTDPRQLTLLTDHGLCHGTAGLHHTAWRIGQDAETTPIRAQLDALPQPTDTGGSATDDLGLLDGAAGGELAFTTCTEDPTAAAWDAAFLLS